MLITMKIQPKPRSDSSASSSRSARASNGEAGASEALRDAISRLKRESIVAAAVELFYHKGYARTTLEEVADAINVTKPFIYAHFKSKTELLAEICMRGTQVSHAALLRATNQHGTPTEKLSTIVRDFMLAVLNHQAHAVIYSREEKELDPKDREAINLLRREFDHRLVEVMEEGVASGEFTIADVPLASLAVIGMIAWSQVWFRPNGRLSREEVAEGAVELALATVRAKLPRRQRKPLPTAQ
jgi:TetR/AcrR family transcriptional regulator, cholesterol catabolism regulator